jgi:hypothetical protein
MPFYPSKVLRTKVRAPTPFFSAVLCLGLTFESFKELGMHHMAIWASKEKKEWEWGQEVGLRWIFKEQRV